LLFYLSQVLWTVGEPSRILAVAIVAACCLSIAGTGRLRILSAATVGLLAFVAIAPVGYWLLAPLEARFPAWDSTLSPPPYGIIALGGDSGRRLDAMAHLSRQFPEARLVYSGRGDSNAAAFEMREQTIDPARVILETSSRNTFENAVDSAQIVKPKADERWLLITSAAHMPRAVGCFRRAGFSVMAYPVDFATQGGSGPAPIGERRLWQLDDAAREWIGLFVYRIVGNTNTLFPGP
jgi:uncharacterized SAM-binding protein YcdF (DUF218 family)